jgi:hypothetical protein
VTGRCPYCGVDAERLVDRGARRLDELLTLRGEAAQLRAICTSLLFYLAENTELLELARAQIDRRWPR